MEFYPCARPGRSGETTDDVPDEVVDEWVSGLPKPKTPAPLDGPQRHCPALRAAAGSACTWARPALKARSSPNGSKAPPSRDDQPSRSITISPCACWPGMGGMPRITRSQVYRVVQEMLPKEQFGPDELLLWLEDTQLRNERARRSHERRRSARHGGRMEPPP